jgi:hypothetical protein
MKKLIILFVFLLSSNFILAQFDKPSFQIGIGLSEPFAQLKGDQYTINTSYQNIPVTIIDPNLLKTNYGAKTGFTIFGTGKINFDKYDILRGTAFLSYTNFNTFQGSKFGNQVDAFIDTNNNIFYAPIPMDYSYTFSNFGFGFGIEVAPTSFTNVFSPYFGANLCFNVMSASLARTKNNRDTVGFSATGFRIGLNLNAGIEAKFTPQFGLAIGVKYDLGNLLLKSSSNGNLADVYEWGANNGNLNDDGGVYYSKLPNYLYDGFARQYNANKKDIDWGTIYIAVNFYPNFAQTTPKKK